MSQSHNLKGIFDSGKLEFIMGVHDAISARIAQIAGFPGLWISGLGLSSVSGLRDSNELSWSQVIDRCELIRDHVSVPSLVDIDTGFGDFNNVRVVIKKLQRLDIGGVCIEDKLFPKTNSFIGDNQQLARPTEFCSKLKAAKDTAADDIYVVARCEALVCNKPTSEAIERCELYLEAGADAILIHSKKQNADEILSFMESWKHKNKPVAIVPTTYSQTDPEVFERAGVSVSIWANQSLRSAIRGMVDLCCALKKEKSMVNLEDSIAELSSVFELVDYGELEDAKKYYKEIEQGLEHQLSAVTS